MRTSVEFVRPRHLTRVAVVALLAGLAAGCSSDTMRFSENPFSDPFRSQPQQTAAIQPAPAYPTPRVRAQPLPPVGSVAAQPLPPLAPVASVPAAGAPRPIYGYNQPVQSARPAQPVVTGSVQSASPRIGGFKGGGWSAAGGTVVAAGAGDSVYTLSNRYGVPADAIMSVNALSAPNLVPGQRITIPVYSTVSAAPPPPPSVAQPLPAAQPLRAEAPVAKPVRTVAVQPQHVPEPEPIVPPRPVAQALPAAPRPAEPKATVLAQEGGLHVVKPGETLTSIALAYGTTRPRLAHDNGIDEWTNVRIGQKLKVPGANTAAAKPAAVKPVHVATVKPEPAMAEQPVKPARLAAKPAAPVKPVKPVQVAAVKPEPVAKPAPAAKPMAAPKATAKVVAPVEPKPVQTATIKPQPAQPQPAQPEPAATASIPAQKEDAPQQAALETPAQRSNTPEFRWPVRGRVIQSFGQSGDGINIAVPEGTDVRAAENGVVAYAGNELKGYGNLVLIRHADGYVTAYAHAKDLNVKRGDTVKRGQVIATAGQTGNVTSPQLLFELRKGAQPVDPRPYLSGT